MSKVTVASSALVGRQVKPLKRPEFIWVHTGTLSSKWVSYPVIGETTRSWIIGPPHSSRKIPKKGPHRCAFSEEEVAQRVWVQKHRFCIARDVQFTQDYETLKQIAELVGYKEEKVS